MRQEAVLSSQIEGTQASLEDILEYESGAELFEKTDDLTEVINYLLAMNWALAELEKLPECIRLIKGAHARRLCEGRGSNKSPGEFRNNQNWIGPKGRPIEEASFVPPAVPLMVEAIGDWERYVAGEHKTPHLIKCALAHAQFETIHPFWDGNGRLGRMIITLLMCSEKVLAHPILYLSLFFKQNREQYYELLQSTRDNGNWEDWVLFFLRGVTATSRAALHTASEITRLRERLLLGAQAMKSRKAVVLGDMLFQRPYVTITRAAEFIGTSFPTASNIVEEFEGAGYLVKVRGEERGRVFGFKPYLDILHEGAGDLTGVLESEDYLITNTGEDAGTKTHVA